MIADGDTTHNEASDVRRIEDLREARKAEKDDTHKLLIDTDVDLLSEGIDQRKKLKSIDSNVARLTGALLTPTADGDTLKIGAYGASIEGKATTVGRVLAVALLFVLVLLVLVLLVDRSGFYKIEGKLAREPVCDDHLAVNP